MWYKYIFFSTLLLFIFACHNHSEDSHSHQNTSEKVTEHPHEELFLDSSQRQKIGISVGTFTKINMNATLKVSGHLITCPSDKATASSLTSGIIQQIMVKHGQQVSKGQILFKIQSPALIDLQKNYLQTYNALQIAQNELKRQKALMQDSATSFKNYEIAQLECDNLNRNLAIQTVELQIYSINPAQIIAGNLQTVYNVIAPISGQIQEVSNNIGQQVANHSSLVTIINNKHLEADLLVFESNVSQVKIGQKLLFDYQNQTYNAQIIAINQELESKDKSLRIHAEVVGNQANLIAGAYIEGRIELSRQDTDCLPADAIAMANGLAYIFLENPHENGFEYTAISVLLGNKQGQWQEVSAVSKLPDSSKIVTKSAFYIMAQSQKSAAAHEH
jgi:membrane fusion protein, heavy metal efflux system